MKPHIRQLLADLKAAVIIGAPDSIYTVFDNLRALPEAQLKTQDLYQLGTTLVPLAIAELRSLIEDADPIIRTMAAVAIAQQYLKGENITPDDLYLLASDPSPEVRANLAKALTQPRGTGEPRALFTLAQSWLTATPPAQHTNLIETGLQLLPATSPNPAELATLLHPLHTATDHNTRRLLVDTLAQLAKNQPTPILDLLAQWAVHPTPNVWLITQTLSASWSFSHSPRAIQILNTLAAQVGEIRAVRRTLKRHQEKTE